MKTSGLLPNLKEIEKGRRMVRREEGGREGRGGRLEAADRAAKKSMFHEGEGRRERRGQRAEGGGGRERGKKERVADRG